MKFRTKIQIWIKVFSLIPDNLDMGKNYYGLNWVSIDNKWQIIFQSDSNVMFSYPCLTGNLDVIVSSKFKTWFMTKLNKLKASISKLVDKSLLWSKPTKNSRAIVDMKSSTEKWSIEELILKRSKKVELFLKSCKLYDHVRRFNNKKSLKL